MSQTSWEDPIPQYFSHRHEETRADLSVKKQHQWHMTIHLTAKRKFRIIVLQQLDHSLPI